MTGKKARKRESETEKEIFGREVEQHRGDRKQRGLILTIGLNQQYLQISTTPENFMSVSIN